MTTTKFFQAIVIVAVLLVINFLTAAAQTEAKSKPVKINHRGGEFYYNQDKPEINEALEHFRVSVGGVYDIDSKGFGAEASFGYSWQHDNFLKGFGADLRIRYSEDEFFGHDYMATSADLLISYEIGKKPFGKRALCNKSWFSASPYILAGYGHYENHTRVDEHIYVNGNSFRYGAGVRLNFRIAAAKGEFLNGTRLWIAAENIWDNPVSLNSENYFEGGVKDGHYHDQRSTFYVSAGVAFSF